MSLTQADEALVILLDHASRDVVFAAVGALVNLGADPQSLPALLDPPCPGADTGCAKLASLVKRAGMQDLALAAVACKALFNALGAAFASLPPSTTRWERQYSFLGSLHETLDQLVDVARSDLESAEAEHFAHAGGALFRLIGERIECEMKPAEASDYDELPLGPHK